MKELTSCRSEISEHSAISNTVLLSGMFTSDSDHFLAVRAIVNGIYQRRGPPGGRVPPCGKHWLSDIRDREYAE